MEKNNLEVVVEKNLAYGWLGVGGRNFHKESTLHTVRNLGGNILKGY